MRVKGCFKKDTDRTVSIRPTPQASDLTAADLITVTNSIDFNSRDPMEREYLSKISIKNVKTTQNISKNLRTKDNFEVS